MARSRRGRVAAALSARILRFVVMYPTLHVAHCGPACLGVVVVVIFGAGCRVALATKGAGGGFEPGPLFLDLLYILSLLCFLCSCASASLRGRRADFNVMAEAMTLSAKHSGAPSGARFVVGRHVSHVTCSTERGRLSECISRGDFGRTEKAGWR